MTVAPSPLLLKTLACALSWWERAGAHLPGSGAPWPSTLPLDLLTVTGLSWGGDSGTRGDLRPGREGPS